MNRESCMPNDLKDDKIDPLYTVEGYSRESTSFTKNKKRNKFFDNKFVICKTIQKEPYDEFKNIYEGILLKVLLVLM